MAPSGVKAAIQESRERRSSRHGSRVGGCSGAPRPPVSRSAPEVLAACGGDDDEAAVTATGGGDTGGPTTGGRLLVGHVGAGKGESFNSGAGSSFIDASRYFNVFDPLSRVSPTSRSSPASRSSGRRTRTPRCGR